MPGLVQCSQISEEWCILYSFIYSRKLVEALLAALLMSASLAEIIITIKMQGTLLVNTKFFIELFIFLSLLCTPSPIQLTWCTRSMAARAWASCCFYVCSSPIYFYWPFSTTLGTTSWNLDRHGWPCTCSTSWWQPSTLAYLSCGKLIKVIVSN